MSNLKDIRTKAIPVMLDKERTVKYDLNAYAELEDKYGSIEAALNKLQEGSLKTVRALLWAGLIHEDETLTEKQVGALIGIAELETVIVAITSAINDSMPEDTPQLPGAQTGN